MNKIASTKALFLGERGGLRFYRIQSRKFKTARTDIFYVSPLVAAKVPSFALTASLLRRGCKTFPSAELLERRLEMLYGAGFDGNAYKKGDAQVVHMSMTHVAERYASGGERLFSESTALLQELLYEPVLENAAFPEAVFVQERDNLVDLIQSRVNDKIRYALLRCVEEMFRGGAYAVPSEGLQSDTLALDALSVADTWRQMVQSQPAFVYLSGDMPEKDVISWMEAFSSNVGSRGQEIPASTILGRRQATQFVTDTMDVSQGKLCMGFGTGMEPNSEDWPAMLVFNGIYGGDLHSKLFQNVREKESLAYYASSRLDRNKGLMFVNSGLQAENREKAEKIILDQLDEMKQGAITDEEFGATLRSLETSFKSAQDSQAGIAEFYFNQHLLGTEDTFDTLSERVSCVTKEDVIRVAKGINLDTVYFLQPNETALKEPEEECD